MQGLIFDSFFDKHRGVVAYIRLFSGNLKVRDTIHFLATNTSVEILEVGVFRPQMEVIDKLENGEVGYIVTGLKELDLVKVGDTICDTKDAKKKLPGYKTVEPKVFASIFPTNADDYPRLREAVAKLKLNDASLTFEVENIAALGFGFRCGFLGLLHLDIVQERLSREFDLDLVVTTPSVEYRLILQNSKNNQNLNTDSSTKSNNNSGNQNIDKDELEDQNSKIKTEISKMSLENWQKIFDL